MKSYLKFREILNSAAPILTIIKENKSAVFFVEFSIQSKYQKWYGWASKGQTHVIWKYLESFRMSFIIWFSGTDKVSIKGNKSRTISKWLQFLLNKLLRTSLRVVILLTKSIFIADNSNFRTTQLVSNVLIKRKAKQITITPYSLWLNLTEQLNNELKSECIQSQATTSKWFLIINFKTIDQLPCNDSNSNWKYYQIRIRVFYQGIIRRNAKKIEPTPNHEQIVTRFIAKAKFY